MVRRMHVVLLLQNVVHPTSISIEMTMLALAEFVVERDFFAFDKGKCSPINI